VASKDAAPFSTLILSGTAYVSCPVQSGANLHYANHMDRRQATFACVLKGAMFGQKKTASSASF
jgi:hypothetical protein